MDAVEFRDDRRIQIAPQGRDGNADTGLAANPLDAKVTFERAHTRGRPLPGLPEMRVSGRH